MSHDHINFFKNLKHIWLNMVEQSDSANQMYLFKVLRRQTIDIINIINVAPVSILLTLNSVRSYSMGSLALY